MAIEAIRDNRNSKLHEAGLAALSQSTLYLQLQEWHLDTRHKAFKATEELVSFRSFIKLLLRYRRILR